MCKNNNKVSIKKKNSSRSLYLLLPLMHLVKFASELYTESDQLKDDAAKTITSKSSFFQSRGARRIPKLENYCVIAWFIKLWWHCLANKKMLHIFHEVLTCRRSFSGNFLTKCDQPGLSEILCKEKWPKFRQAIRKAWKCDQNIQLQKNSMVT